MTSTDFTPGLEGIVAVQTRLSRIDGQAGELIIGGFPVEELSREAQDRLKGEAGKPVTLTVARQGETFELELRRGPVQRRSVKWGRLLDAEKGIGYVQISDFQNRTQEEFDEQLERLESLCEDGRQRIGDYQCRGCCNRGRAPQPLRSQSL